MINRRCLGDIVGLIILLSLIGCMLAITVMVIGFMIIPVFDPTSPIESRVFGAWIFILLVGFVLWICGD